jgi:hypothetical protein
VVLAVQNDRLDKPAGVPCEHQCDAGCAIHTSPDRPKRCGRFLCSWRRGFGGPNDRPDKSRALVFISELCGRPWSFVFDLDKNAHRTTGRNLVLSVVQHVQVPGIVVDYDSKPPNDAGDFAIVHDSLLDQTRPMRGRKIVQLAADVGVFDLVTGGP